jgi:hypothetical protein
MLDAHTNVSNFIPQAIPSANLPNFPSSAIGWCKRKSLR